MEIFLEGRDSSETYLFEAVFTEEAYRYRPEKVRGAGGNHGKD